MLNTQDDLHTRTQSSFLDNEPISKGEWHFVPGPHGSLPYDYLQGHAMFGPASTPSCSNIPFDDELYLNLPREVMHYPEDYHHLLECAQDYRSVQEASIATVRS